MYNPSKGRRREKGEATTYLSATHPRAEGELDVLAAPDVHGVVKAADVVEVVLPHGDGAADECRRAVGLGLTPQSTLLVRRHLHPHVPARGEEHMTSRHRTVGLCCTAVVELLEFTNKYTSGRTDKLSPI